MKHIIIGGVAGGATAAARIRRADETAEIVLLEKGRYISYANCGLPYYIGGTIAEREKLFVQTPTSFGTRFRIDVRVESEAVAVDPAAKTVTVHRADGSTYTEHYDKLLLSPGASPCGRRCKGSARKASSRSATWTTPTVSKPTWPRTRIGRAVVVGAGFIGLEMAENLHRTGAHVSIVEMGNQVMAPVDFSIASHVHQHLLQKGVALYLEQSVERFEKQGEQVAVVFRSGERIMADIVILSIGVRPETSLAESAGIRIGETGGIRVDEYLETSAKDIYAVGDAHRVPAPDHRKAVAELPGQPRQPAGTHRCRQHGFRQHDTLRRGHRNLHRQGVRHDGRLDGTPGETAPAAGNRVRRFDHALGVARGYYPDALPLTIKLTFDPRTGRLYGAQSVGYDGVDKRIDQIALLIKRGGTVRDLAEVEHCYAPPFSSAKDPIAIAGYVAGNIVSGAMSVVSWREITDAACRDGVLLDVRTPMEYAFGTIPGAVNIPLEELRDRLDEIPKDKAVYIFCAVGCGATWRSGF